MAKDVRVFVSSHPCLKWAFPLTSMISSSPSPSFSHSSSTSSSSCYPSTSPRFSSKISCATLQRRMGSTDESFSNTGYEPKAYYLMETYVESLKKSMTEQRLLEQRFLEDVDYDDAAIGEMLFNSYREQVYHSQREGLSVGQSSSSSSSVSDRSGQPVVERGQELNTEHAQIRTLLDRQRSFGPTEGANPRRLSGGDQETRIPG